MQNDADNQPDRRRPQWRGERQAVLVRLPVAVAERLRAAAAGRGVSVSDTAGDLIASGLGTGA